MVDLIDVGMGNIRSISNILAKLSISCQIISDPNDMKSDTVILPGVGSARPFMNRLREKKFDKAIYDHTRYGKKVIGICLGFQVMTKFSEEDGGIKCLGLINTKTIALANFTSSNHNQWEKFSLRKSDLYLQQNHPSILNSRHRLVDGRVFYNHEYGVKISSEYHYYKSIDSNTYSVFAAMYCRDNIIGIQFHPEKSQVTGLKLLSLIL